ncbi:MAG: hypothetical protein M0D57_10450 [Sphingobacteriales bacterium JAD_PAG50586_3]|nr:MAG: hypothetical protein M0D57_10450 [Sphingobacteriales bacterium JAD_PAG50586_3]
MHNSTSNDAFNGHVFVSNTGSGGIYFGSTSTGTGTLASGKIISVGANGFSNGTLGLRRFTQTGSTAQNITLTGTTTTLAIGGTDASGLVTWNGNITTSSANVTIANTTCNGKATFTKTGTSSNFCVGNNTFNDTLKIYVNNSGFVKLTNTLSDTYNSGVEYRLASTGLIASGTTATYKGNLFIATNNNNISFGGSITFSGTNSQSISKSGTGAIRTETIVINKASNNLTIYNNLGADAITLTSGKIIANSPTDTLKLGGAAPSGGSSTSYIDAALTFRITYAATNYTLPIGSGSVYQPVTINAPSVGSKSDFFFRYFGQGQLLGSSADTSVANLSYCEYWRVVQISGTATSPYITFGWKSTSCNAAKPANMRVARWTGSQWVNEGNGASTGNNTAGTVRTNGTQATQGYYTISNKTCSYAASITPTGATSFCPGGDVTLTANSSKYYNWSTGATSQAIVSGANGIHTVIVRDTSGCKGTANQTLTVYPKPIAEAGNDTTITYSENFILGTSTAGYSGTAPYSYLWTAVNFIDSINIKRPRIYIESEDAVVFKVTDANGCFDVDTLDISVLYSTSSSNEDLECWTPNITFQTTYSPVGCINYLQDLENGILNERTYRLKVHVFQKDDTTGDFSLSDSSYIRNIVNELNDVYSNLQSPTLLVDTNITIPTIIDSKIRFNVIGEINFHQDTEAWKGSSRRVKFYKPSISITSNYIDNDSNYIVIPQTRFRDYYLNQISSTNQVKLINFDDFTEYDLLIDTVTPFQNNKSKVKISGDLNLPPSAANYRIAYNYGQKIISVDTVQRVFVLKGFKPEIRGDFDVNFEGYFRNGKGKIELGIPTDSILINYFNNTSVKFSIDSVYGSGTLTGGLTYVKVNEPISNISNTAIVYTWYVEKNIAPVGTAWQFDKIKHKYFSDKSFVHLYFNGVDYITDKTGGYGKPNFLEMNNFNSSLPTAPGLRSLLKHEIGHTIGLPHPSDNVDGICSWQDTYWDTFHPDCESGDCNTSTISNNIMGQSNCRNYLSPLQINKLYEVVTNYQDGLIYTGCSVGGGDPFHVSSNQTWLNTRAFDGDLIIDPGVTLIVKCTVNMAKHTRVIIKNDSLGLQNAGKLIIDGGTFTNGCYQFWKGIEVWGDRTASQTASPQKQGIIEVKNGGRIENALTGISTIRRNSNGSLNWAYTGGIVRIDSAYFINNVQGINILSYHSTASSPEPYNRSYIRNSNFETNYNWPNVEKNSMNL